MLYKVGSLETTVLSWLSAHEKNEIFLKNGLDLPHFLIQVPIFSGQICFLVTFDLTSTKKVEKKTFSRKLVFFPWIYPKAKFLGLSKISSLLSNKKDIEFMSPYSERTQNSESY